MNWLQSILYGLLSGITEFLPISSSAHQALLLRFFGVERQDFLCDFLVHFSILISLLVCCRTMLHGLRREEKLYSASRDRRIKRTPPKGWFDIRLVRTAVSPLLVGMLLLLVTAQLRQTLGMIALFLLLNGIILFLPERMSSANKDARSMSKLDGFAIGLAGALSVFPGISRVGATASAAAARGAEKHSALTWALLLSVPALAMLMGFDILHLFTQGLSAFSFQTLVGYILAPAAAFGGGYLGIFILRLFAARGFSGFAYYCWGAALFTFFLYLVA